MISGRAIPIEESRIVETFELDPTGSGPLTAYALPSRPIDIAGHKTGCGTYLAIPTRLPP
jgi:hypothetical protein